MSFDSWLLGISALLFAGVAVQWLWVGRTSGSTHFERGSEPAGYWLRTAFILLVATLFCWTWIRAVRGDESADLQSGLFFGPYFLYLILESLRAGEVRWGYNRFPRRARAQVYWTILLLCLIASAFFFCSLIYDRVAEP